MSDTTFANNKIAVSSAIFANNILFVLENLLPISFTKNEVTYHSGEH